MGLAAAHDVLVAHSHCTEAGNKLSAPFEARAHEKHLACTSDKYSAPRQLVATLSKGSMSIRCRGIRLTRYPEGAVNVMVTWADPLESTASWPGRAAAKAEGASKNVGPTCRRAALVAIAVPKLPPPRQKTQGAALSAANVMAGVSRLAIRLAKQSDPTCVADQPP